MEQQHITAREIVDRWPSRKELASDLSAETVTVHRWVQRNSIPGWYDARILNAAKTRGIKLTADELVMHRASHNEQFGQAIADIQPASSKEERTA